MNPIPQTGPIPNTALFANGYLDILLLITVVSLLVIFGMMLWTMRGVVRERVRLYCPVRLRPVRVLFRLAPDGRRMEVIRCSVFGRRPITCGKACLRPMAPA